MRSRAIRTLGNPDLFLLPNRPSPGEGRHRVTLLFNPERAFDVKVMTGAAQYLLAQDGYSVGLEAVAWAPDRWRGLDWSNVAGIVANMDLPEASTLVRRLGIPTVGFGCGPKPPTLPMPYFRINNASVAALAAEHLLEFGPRALAYCGYPSDGQKGWAADREAAFVIRARQLGRRTSVFRGNYPRSSMSCDHDSALMSWIRELPKPVGILAADDLRGREVVEACRECGISVPNDVSVVGVDNDEMVTQLCRPALSSIDHGATRLGQAAAAGLRLLFEGGRPAISDTLIDAVRVITRQSTDVAACCDSDVRLALAFIRDHAARTINVSDVVHAVGTSRSKLEGKFRQVHNATIGETVRSAHLQRARCLIAETDLAMKEVAAMSGFKSVQYMTTLYRRAFGSTPARDRVQSLAHVTSQEPDPAF
ncbi:MAG: substrate-binding domain-containing protein [Acidobacteriota bacterium]